MFLYRYKEHWHRSSGFWNNWWTNFGETRGIGEILLTFNSCSVFFYSTGINNFQTLKKTFNHRQFSFSKRILLEVEWKPHSMQYHWFVFDCVLLLFHHRYYSDVVKFSKKKRTSGWWWKESDEKQTWSFWEIFAFVFESTWAARTLPEPDFPIRPVENPIESW